MKRICLIVAALVSLSAACGGPQEPTDDIPKEETVGEESGESTEQADETDETAETTEEDMPAVADPNAPADVAAPPADAETTESGLAYKILTPGTGDETPTTTSMVRVHYTGWTTDGVKFDSSVDRGEPAEFPLDKVIPGWTEGVSLMKVGEKRRLWIPVELAYNNRPDRPMGMLVFDVELLAIVK